MAISIIENTISWEEENFKKRRISKKSYYNEIRQQLAESDSSISKCTWCGKKFVKKHHGEKYCSQLCRKDARSQQSRNKAHRWYHRHKHELTEKQRWGLGSGTLGGHMHDDFEKEQSVIEKEFARLRLKRKR